MSSVQPECVEPFPCQPPLSTQLQGRGESAAAAREVPREGLQPGVVRKARRHRRLHNPGWELHQKAAAPPAGDPPLQRDRSSSGRRPRKGAWARNHFKQPERTDPACKSKPGRAGSSSRLVCAPRSVAGLPDSPHVAVSAPPPHLSTPSRPRPTALSRCNCFQLQSVKTRQCFVTQKAKWWAMERFSRHQPAPVQQSSQICGWAASTHPLLCALELKLSTSLLKLRIFACG